MPIVHMSNTGRITIPLKIRKQLGIEDRVGVSIKVQDNEIILRPLTSLTSLAGVFAEYAEGKTTDMDEIMEQTMAAVAKDVVRKMRRQNREREKEIGKEE